MIVRVCMAIVILIQMVEIIQMAKGTYTVYLSTYWMKALQIILLATNVILLSW